MNALDYLGAALGMNALTLDIELDEMQHHRGDIVTGVVRMRGGKVPQTIVLLTAILRNYRTDGKSVRIALFHTVLPADGLRLEPDEQHEVPLSFRLNEYAPLTRTLNAGVRLEVVARLTWGRARHHWRTLFVVPQREFFVVTQALTEMGFLLSAPFEEMMRGGDVLHASFEMRPELRDQATLLELFLAKRGDQMQGKFVLHRPHSFIEPFFRSGSVRPQNTLSFELECAALHSLDRAANVTAAIPLLRELLGQLMILPEQPSGWMLRASHAPLEDSEELLRPAASASPTDPAELLRPMREEGEKRSKGEGENSSTHNSVRITFLPQNVTVSAQHGDTLLDAALDNKIELEHDCGGNCACTTCHVLVLEGAENVSKMEEVEDDRLSTAPQRQSQSRLACQAIVRGDVVVQIPDADLWDAEI